MNDKSAPDSISDDGLMETILNLRKTDNRGADKQGEENTNARVNNPFEVDSSKYPESKDIHGELSADTGETISNFQIVEDDSQVDTQIRDYEETRKDVGIKTEEDVKPVKDDETVAEEESKGSKITFADTQSKEIIHSKAERLFVLCHDRMSVLFGDKSVSELRKSGGNHTIDFKPLPSNFLLENYRPQVPLQIFYKPKLESLEDTDHFFRYMGMVVFYVKRAEEFKISIECVDYDTGDDTLTLVFRLIDGNGDEVDSQKELVIEL